MVQNIILLLSVIKSQTIRTALLSQPKIINCLYHLNLKIITWNWFSFHPFYSSACYINYHSIEQFPLHVRYLKALRAFFRMSWHFDLIDWDVVRHVNERLIEADDSWWIVRWQKKKLIIVRVDTDCGFSICFCDFCGYCGGSRKMRKKNVGFRRSCLTTWEKIFKEGHILLIILLYYLWIFRY